MTTNRLFILFLTLLAGYTSKAQLISNGGFGLGTLLWGCGVEANTELSYGGSSGNMVVEVDAGAGLCQTIIGLTIGNTYVLTFNSSRRLGSCPSPAITNVDITVSGGALATTVTRTNTVFGWSTNSYLFVANSVIHTIDFSAGSGFGGSTCGMIIDNVNVSFSPLPIKLLYFDAKYKNNAVEIEWSTATETNNHYFEIEKSEDGIDYTTIAQLPSKAAQGNSSVRIHYDCKDFHPSEKTNYYRMKQVDYDNAFSYSPVVAVKSEISKKNEFIYPNPNNGEFVISTEVEGYVKISFVNHIGNEVFSELQTIEKESGEIKIHAKDKLTSGVYQCIVSGTDYYKNFRCIVQ